MNSFINIIHRISNVGTAAGAIFLAGIMLLIVANIITRLFGNIIAGTYELIELWIVVTIPFALVYTALKQGHVAMAIVVSRFSRRTQAIIASFTWLLSLGTWGLIAWGNIDLLLTKWTRELSELLEVPYLPFRIVWVFGLLLLCIVFLIDMIKALKQAGSR